MEFMMEDEPVSPCGQYFTSSSLSVSILVVLEFEFPFDDSQFIKIFLEDRFVPSSPRFSSIMVTDKNGVKRWKKVEINLKDHVKTPTFPSGETPEFYDKCFDDYLSKITMEQFPQNQPLWDVHIIKYPTSKAASNMIFKIHHSIGDGYSLMGVLLSSFKRADNPSLPLTFPSGQPRNYNSTKKDENKSMFDALPFKILSSMFNTAADFSWSFMKSNLVKDDDSPILYGDAALLIRPITIPTISFSLDLIKKIKDNLGVTTNDVITGTIFLGTRLYMHAMNQSSSNADSTALVLLNTRMLRSYKTAKDMIKTNAESLWGNRFAFLHIPIPKIVNDGLNPLEFIKEAHEIIDKKKTSAAVYLTGWLLGNVHKFRGAEVAAKNIHTTVRNSSMLITNMVGPDSKMSVANQPIKGFYFAVVGNPQILTTTILSYMGEIRVGLVVKKDYIDAQKLKSCIESAFEAIYKEACTPSLAEKLIKDDSI